MGAFTGNIYVMAVEALKDALSWHAMLLWSCKPSWMQSTVQDEVQRTEMIKLLDFLRKYPDAALMQG
jgi:hypothetical protein